MQIHRPRSERSSNLPKVTQHHDCCRSEEMKGGALSRVLGFSPWSQEAPAAGGHTWLPICLRLSGSPIRALGEVEPHELTNHNHSLWGCVGGRPLSPARHSSGPALTQPRPKLCASPVVSAWQQPRERRAGAQPAWAWVWQEQVTWGNPGNA